MEFERKKKLKQIRVNQFFTPNNKQESPYLSENGEEKNFNKDKQQSLNESETDLSQKSPSNLKRASEYFLDENDIGTPVQKTETSEILSEKQLLELMEEPDNEADIIKSDGDLLPNLKKTKTPREKKNPVWKHFTVNNEDVVCNYCIPKKSFSLKTHPSNLQYHIEHLHPSKIISPSTPSDESEKNSDHKKITDFIPTRKSLTEFRQDITKLLVGTSSAPYLLENEVFIGFFNKWLPSYKLPYRKLHNQIVDVLYENKRKEIKDFFDNRLLSKVSLTFDGWSSISGEHYFGITGNIYRIVEKSFIFFNSSLYRKSFVRTKIYQPRSCLYPSSITGFNNRL
jgi:hypothetical protein